MDLGKFCSKEYDKYLGRQTSSQPTPKIHASESELLLKDQNLSVEFEEILDFLKLPNRRIRL